MQKYHLVKMKDRGGVWYYWYWDGEKRVKKSTRRKKLRGPDGAEEFIEALEREDAFNPPAPHGRARFRDIAEGMFLPGAAHLQRRELRDTPIKEYTRRQHRLNLERLMKWFGDYYLDEVTEDLVEDKLMGIIPKAAAERESPEAREERLAIRGTSGSWKNGHLYTLKHVFLEAKREKYINSMPAFTPFPRKYKRQGTLEDGELDLLFPMCPGALECQWRSWNPRSRIADPPGSGLMLGAFFALMVSAGLRSGEARAAHLDQYIPARKCFIVNRAFDNDGILGLPKEGREDNPRIRVAPLPDRTIQILGWWLKFRGDAAGYLFTYRGHPMDEGGFMGDRWTLGLAAAGVDPAGRKLTPHCLRYTYNTRMRRRLPGPVLQAIVGHLSEDMSAYYDNPAVNRLIEDLAPYQGVVNAFWGPASGAGERMLEGPAG